MQEQTALTICPIVDSRVCKTTKVPYNYLFNFDLQCVAKSMICFRSIQHLLSTAKDVSEKFLNSWWERTKSTEALSANVCFIKNKFYQIIGGNAHFLFCWLKNSVFLLILPGRVVRTKSNAHFLFWLLFLSKNVNALVFLFEVIRSFSQTFKMSIRLIFCFHV